MTETTEPRLTLNSDIPDPHRAANLLVASVTRPVPEETALAARIGYERILHEDFVWGASWAALLLTRLLQTLPPPDPWRHLAASDGHAIRVIPGVAVPDGEIGAWNQRGDRFGFADCVDIVGIGNVDAYADPTLCTVAGGISAEAACLLGMAAHSSHSAYASIERLARSLADVGVPVGEVLAEMAEHISSALRWAGWRRACYCLDDLFVDFATKHAARHADAITGRAALPAESAVSMITAGAIDPGAYLELKQFHG